MKKCMIATALAVVLSSAGAQAAPNLQGETGLIQTPSADVLRNGQFGAGYFSERDGYRISAGAGFANKVEFSWSGVRPEQGGNRNELNVKFGLIGEKVLLPGVVFGVSDLTAERQRSYYAVTSKSLPFGYRLHIGAGNGRYDGVFAGVEKRFFPGITTIVEYDGRHFNFGGRISSGAGVQWHAGWRQGDKKSYFGVTLVR